VIQVEDKKPPRTVTYDEAKLSIRNKLSQDQIESQFGDWMKKLRDNAYTRRSSDRAAEPAHDPRQMARGLGP
jgi:parvulin-like peptidyl-prolyl isomerase